MPQAPPTAMATACATLAPASGLGSDHAATSPSAAKAAVQSALCALSASNHELSIAERGAAKQVQFEINSAKQVQFEAELQAALPGLSALQAAAQPEKDPGQVAYVCAFPGCLRPYRKSDGGLTLPLTPTPNPPLNPNSTPTPTPTR